MLLTSKNNKPSREGTASLLKFFFGSCKALTLVWYANRKNIPLDSVEVVIQRDSSQERAGTYRLVASLSLGGDLSEDQRQELLKVADKCPVHKLMTTVTTIIETRLVA